MNETAKAGIYFHENISRKETEVFTWDIKIYQSCITKTLYRKFVLYNIQEEKFRNWKNSSLTWIRKRYSNGPTTREHEKEGRAITYQIREMYGGVNSPIKVELTIFLSGPDWYRLSSSEAWHHLEAYVDLIEKERIRSQLQGQI